MKLSIASVFALAAVSIAPSFALAQSAQCRRAAACCQAAMASMGQPPTACEQLASAPDEACAQAITQFAAVASRMGGGVPPACAGAPMPGGPVAPTAPPPPPPPPAPSTTPPPQPLSADDASPARSQNGLIACQMVRVDGHRAMLTGATQTIDLQCTGIASRTGPMTTVATDRTYDGRRVRVQWSVSPQDGQLDFILSGRAIYRAPARVSAAQAEVTVRAMLSIEGPGNARESMIRTSQIHVINRRLRLDVLASVNLRCARPAGPWAGYDLTCNQGIDLEIGDDFSVSSSNSTSCGHGTWAGLQPCGGGIRVQVPEANWSLDSVVGRADPTTGILDLRISGNRVGGPATTRQDGTTEQPQVHPLFQRPLEMGPDDGESRGFGSPSTTPHAGGYTAFQLHAR